MEAYRDKGFVHAALSVNVILAHNLVAVLHALAALESADPSRIPSEGVRWVIRI